MLESPLVFFRFWDSLSGASFLGSPISLWGKKLRNQIVTKLSGHNSMIFNAIILTAAQMQTEQVSSSFNMPQRYLLTRMLTA